MSTSLCSTVTYSAGLGEREAEREREDISCIISCSSTRCLSDLVHDMPPCFSVSSSLALLYLILSLHPPVSLTDAHFICLPVFPSQLYLCTHGLQLAAEEAHSEPGWACLLPPAPPSGRDARCRLSLYTHFWPHGQEGVFSVALGWRFQKAFSFALSVWAACLTKTQTPFFRPEVLVLAS